MRTYAIDNSVWSSREREWLGANGSLRRHVLDELETRGPLLSREFDDVSEESWDYGWTGGRNVSRMLAMLHVRGEVLVAGRSGGARVFDLPDRVLPADTPREALSQEEAVRRSAERSLRALGVARRGHIATHFTRSRYPNLPRVLADLEASGRIERVDMFEGRRPLTGPWYIHADDLALAERLAAGDWEPRTTLLSPFDNLICDRARTEELFDFRYRLQIYVPKAKRQGFWVMPILHGDRLIGRADLIFDRRAKRLEVRSLRLEPGAPAAARPVGRVIADLARFVGAESVSVGDVPARWQGSLERGL